MLDTKAIQKVRRGTCAVGYLTVPVEDYVKDPTRPVFRIVGSGFLIRDDVVLTNSHVINRLNKLVKSSGQRGDPRYLQFVYPTASRATFSLVPINRYAPCDNPHLDVGALQFKRPEAPEFAACQPLAFMETLRVSVGDSIGLYGYPSGTNLLKRDTSAGERIYRLGPVLQRGFVSAIAPSDDHDVVDRLLLDIRSSEGMSGSPVFSLATGVVLGIHDSGHEQVTQFALPLDASRVESICRVVDGGTDGGQISVTFNAIHRDSDKPGPVEPET